VIYLAGHVEALDQQFYLLPHETRQPAIGLPWFDGADINRSTERPGYGRSSHLHPESRLLLCFVNVGQRVCHERYNQICATNE